MLAYLVRKQHYGEITWKISHIFANTARIVLKYVAIDSPTYVDQKQHTSTSKNTHVDVTKIKEKRVFVVWYCV